MSRIHQLLLLLTAVVLFSFTDPTDCKSLRNSKLMYMADKEQIMVSITDSIHTEIHGNGKYFVKSKIEWASDCEMHMTIVKVTVPGFAYGVGDEFNVQVTKIDGNQVYYTITVKRVSWNGMYTRLDY